MDPVLEVFLQLHGGDLQDFINSREAVEAVMDKWDWEELKRRIEVHLGQPLPPPVEEAVAADLRDWWKQGNFYIWEEDEVNAFGMMKWEAGDEDFWR